MVVENLPFIYLDKCYSSAVFNERYLSVNYE